MYEFDLTFMIFSKYILYFILLSFFIARERMKM